MKNNFGEVSLMTMCIFLNIFVSSGTDTISANQSLVPNQTLISSGGNFALGFFKPGNSANFYMGIWYNKVSTQTIVWVANRENPIHDLNSVEVKVVGKNLVIVSGSNNTIWSTNVSSTASGSVVAVLLDDGNLVLRDGSSNSSVVIWQSFDYPTNTFLPGGKIGYNKVTGRRQVLTSWKNNEDPGIGLYSLELDPNNNQFIIMWNGSEEYWTSGPWNGEQFSLVPEMRLNYIFNYSYVANQNESYFTYSLYNPSFISRLIMDATGQIEQLTWLDTTQQWNLFWSQPRLPCDVYGLCGAYGSCNPNFLPFCSCLFGFIPSSPSDWSLSDFSGGCMRKAPLHCGEDVGFLQESHVELPSNSQLIAVGSDVECQSVCLKNCSCTAYAYYTNGCSIWIGELLNLNQLAVDDGNGKTVFIKLAPSDLPNSPAHNITIKSAAGIISGFVAFIALGVVGYLIYRRRLARRRESRVRSRGDSGLYMYDIVTQASYLLDPGRSREDYKKGIDVPSFEFQIILAATDNFSDANKLGQGGFGPVYKGKLSGGKEIAVKRLSSHSKQGFKEFKTEVLLIAKLQHRNLVSLLGYCMEGPEMMIVYEYLPNKSLDRFIFDRDRCMLLDWTIRFDLILGIARGLLYLHQGSRFRIIHRDLKTSNILLDEDMNPKISDFGLAKILDKGGEAQAITKRVIGT